ncbi:MAG: hypothetical protein HN350_00745 [Phycisphaerales bacterium]|jgi:hypothetical protein|nr:hypothetical protein [Phycisphaerales bacterium]
MIITKKWIAIVLLLMLSTIAAFLNADEKAIRKAIEARGKIIDTYGYKLKVTSFESKCNVELSPTPRKASTYTLNIDASCKMPDDVDGVLITEKIKVLKALTDRGANIIKPAKARSGRTKKTYKTGTFTPILHLGKTLRVAEVKVDKLELITNPFRIARLETVLAVVIASARDTKTIPATVSQTSRELATGLKARVSTMRINSKRELYVEIACLRREAGPRGPFIEVIKAVDSSGKTIGVGRINEGDPLSLKGNVIAEFTLTGKGEPAELEITVVTESSVKTIPFEIGGIFQK